MAARAFRLPMLVGYIIGGIIFGNLLPQIAHQPLLQAVADVGVTLLLFTLGLEFSFQRLQKLLRSVFVSVLVQVGISAVLFTAVMAIAGLSLPVAMCVGLAGALSSTAIVVKTLSEKGELDTAPGELATAWLVVQDLLVLPILIFLPVVAASLNSDGQISWSSGFQGVGLGFLKSAIVLGSIFFLGRIGVARLLSAVARVGSRELLLLTTVALVFLAAILTYAFGLSAAFGAFIAGLLIARTSQQHAVFAEIRPLRDLFGVVFFVSLGLLLPVSVLGKFGWVLLAMTLVIVFIKFFLVFGLLRISGQHRKTAFLVGVSLTQMSEFGFILAAEGSRLGLLPADMYGFLVALTLATILLSSPLLASGGRLYYLAGARLGRFLPQFFPAGHPNSAGTDEVGLTDHVVICGYGRVGKYIGRALLMSQVPFVVVDYNHATVSQLRSEGITVVYGDPADKDVLDAAQVDFARTLIVAIPDRHTQELIIGHALTLNKKIKIICRTHHEEDQARLKSLGVATIIQPEFEAAVTVVRRLLSDFGVPPGEQSGKISRLKLEHGLG